MDNVKSKLFEIGKRAELFAIAATIALLFYVLSIGPACWLKQRGALPRVVVQMYGPLEPVMARFETFDRAIMRYQCWWLGEPYTQLRRQKTLETAGFP